MQTAENKRRESFLIAEIRGFFKTRSPFLDTGSRRFDSYRRFSDSQRLAPARRGGRGPSNLQNSNRHTPEKLEISVTHTKQRSEPLPNRQRHAVFFVSNRHSFSYFPNRPSSVSLPIAPALDASAGRPTRFVLPALSDLAEGSAVTKGAMFSKTRTQIIRNLRNPRQINAFTISNR
jgi:hypothetical protein